MKKFWILWSPESSQPPRVRFEKKRKALDVGRKMADRYRPQQFFVCSADSRFGPVMSTRKVRRTILR